MASTNCGCYYVSQYDRTKKNLPLVESEVHSTILQTTSRTLLKQSFTNSGTGVIERCIYDFPLYDGVSVVKFVCKIGNRTIHGTVQEKSQAKETFDKAVAKGKTAGLLSQCNSSSDVFSTSLGNVPQGATIKVEITYVGELKHDVETDGIRFTIPTRIAPRYGTSNWSTARSIIGPPTNPGDFKITVDTSMAEDITGIQSPSHPINVTLGALSTDSDETHSAKKASVTLAQSDATLDKDFILIVLTKELDTPKAVIETHSSIPNHRALMVTVVPKFQLPPCRPEIVFVADRSGSMEGQIPALISAMKVFLHSMPLGVKFNICSFGSDYRFLWKRSQSYSKESLAEATAHLLRFKADLGGTETFYAIEATIRNRFRNLPLEIILLTDGDIWDQKELFTYVDSEVTSSGGQIRVFPIGIGWSVSSSLIQGLARAGNGIAHHILGHERFDKSVVRILKQALSPHITDYTLEIKYNTDGDDFEIIEKVEDGVKNIQLSEKNEKTAEHKEISLFDPSCNVDSEVAYGESEAELPDIGFPKLLQAPHKIPSLFPHQRAVVYVLMSPSEAQRVPTAVVLRATSHAGPLHLEIPIEMLEYTSDTIHQLAARKAVQDLEEGRGWMYDIRDDEGKTIEERFDSLYVAEEEDGKTTEERFESQFQGLIKKEAVRLGEQFQIVNKWCSFVAVEGSEKCGNTATQKAVEAHYFGEDEEDSDSETVDEEYSDEDTGYELKRKSALAPRFMSGVDETSDEELEVYDEPDNGEEESEDEDEDVGFGLFDDGPSRNYVVAQGSGARLEDMSEEDSEKEVTRTTYRMKCLAGTLAPGSPDNDSKDSSIEQRKALADQKKVHALISLQDFAGFWDIETEHVISDIVGMELNFTSNEEITLFVILWLEREMAQEKEVWELVIEKAREWVVESVGSSIDAKEMEEIISDFLKPSNWQ